MIHVTCHIVLIVTSKASSQQWAISFGGIESDTWIFGCVELGTPNFQGLQGSTVVLQSNKSL